jgi:serine phosphatase RsbU (regulator of sigma subunit)
VSKTEDIVTRLRAVLHNDKSVELMNREAADEIKRLRQLSGDAGRLREERDEARREVNERNRRCVELQYRLRDAAETELLLQQEICRLVAERANMTSVDVAQNRGWDCYKCRFCGVVDTVDRKRSCPACNKDFHADE